MNYSLFIHVGKVILENLNFNLSRRFKCPWEFVCMYALGNLCSIRTSDIRTGTLGHLYGRKPSALTGRSIVVFGPKYTWHLYGRKRPELADRTK